jgi:hypothetical protein
LLGRLRFAHGSIITSPVLALACLDCSCLLTLFPPRDTEEEEKTMEGKGSFFCCLLLYKGYDTRDFPFQISVC